MNRLINLGIINKNDKAVVSSRIVAEKFNKRTDNVLRDIRVKINEFTALKIEVSKYFIESSYKDDTGKLARRNETDIIMTKLIPLSVSQGSKNAGKLYMTYSKLVNDCVGIPSKSRDKATRRILDVIYNLENLIEHVVSEEVAKGTYYKDIYQVCKGKCKLLVELSYLPEQRLIA